MLDLRLMCILEYRPEQWRFFFDISSSKSVLLHDSNQYGFIPIAHSLNLKDYEATKSFREMQV